MKIHTGVRNLAKIVIEKTDLIGAEQLAQFLERRMAEVIWHEPVTSFSTSDRPDYTADAFVCSRLQANSIGGTSKIAEIARSFKASKVLIIGKDETGEFSVSSEMRGNLIYLNMAEADCENEHLIEKPLNYSLQTACSLLLDEKYVAVADQKALI